jgi:hypothetical protein
MSNEDTLRRSSPRRPANPFPSGRGPFVNTGNDRPCPVCGETTILAYPGMYRNWAEIRCIEGHHQGWAEWPELDS